MKWHDARVEPPHEEQAVFVRGFLETGSLYCYMGKDWTRAPNLSGYVVCSVKHNPWYATVREVYLALNKELDSDD